MKLMSWLRNLRSMLFSSTKRPSRAARRRARPALECLENRLVPSATMLVSTQVNDYNNDGTADAIQVATKTVDNHGNVLADVTTNDWNADGVVDQALGFIAT